MTRITDQLIKYPSHEHLLEFRPPSEAYECNACKELGFGSSYTCEPCNFHLHEECAMAHPEATHAFFPGCTFSLLAESRKRVCDACGRAVHGISYRCSHRDVRHAHDAHPCCLALPPVIKADNGLPLHLSSNASSECGRCRKKEAASKVKGFSYVSNCGAYCFHVACVKEMILERYKKGYFNNVAGTNNSVLPLPAITGSGSSTALARTSNGSKLKVALRIAAVVFKVIVSAIFGNPAAGVAILIEALYK